jgi:hypothetical protein
LCHGVVARPGHVCLCACVCVCVCVCESETDARQLPVRRDRSIPQFGRALSRGCRPQHQNPRRQSQCLKNEHCPQHTTPPQPTPPLRAQRLGNFCYYNPDDADFKTMQLYGAGELAETCRRWAAASGDVLRAEECALEAGEMIRDPFSSLELYATDVHQSAHDGLLPEAALRTSQGC